MPGLVEQLQADALDQNVSVSSLLGKVKVCAVRLGLQDALDWVRHETYGYNDFDGDDLPSYRIGFGITSAQDEFGRWMPIQIEDPELANKIAKVYFKDAVGAFEELLKNKTGEYVCPLSPHLVSALSNAYGVNIVAMRNKVSRGALTTIVATVRDMVLDWSLELSRARITGEGMSFTADERIRATGAHISIGSFHGTFSAGDASGAGALISQTYTSLSNDVPAITELVAAVRAVVGDQAEREAIVQAAQDIAAAPDKGAMLKAYERLLSAAANHMTVIAPFLPALGQMLAG